MNRKKTETDLFDFNIRYEKEKDNYNTINTNSVLEKKEKQFRQFYTGLYFEKCYHNTGRYKWLDGDKEYVYEGKLYANDLHGYGRLVYPDKSKYEGLFYHNKRFGPGVITYPEGRQDVGLWNGKYLIRLSQNMDLADFYLDNVPNLAKTMEGNLFLLKFKEIVSLVDKKDPVAKLAKKYQLTSEDCQKLYSKCVRNHKSIFMNRSVYDKNFYTDPRELIEDVIDHFDENNEPVLNKITATNLLAWNNDKTCIEIMKHTFMNRKYEKIIDYKIRSAFLPNRRDAFMTEGPIEEMCLKLLIACRDDDTVNISKLISDYDLYPNVSDCYGNTPIIYAAMANKRNAIKTLVNFGANVNSHNDECLSALMLCVLHYIAIKNDISEDNWEPSFLKSSNNSSVFVDGRMWPTGSSSSSFQSESKCEFKITNSEKSFASSTTDKVLNKKLKKMSKNKKENDKMINKQYVFNLIYKAPRTKALSKREIALRKKLKLSLIHRRTSEGDKREGLTNVLKTIDTLIKCGADVNGCDVPYPLLISSLFSDNVDLVQMILDSNVDVNKQTRRDSGQLNPLHIACTMDKTPNQEVIVNMLLDYGADVNARSDIEHWPEDRDYFLAGEPLDLEDNELGKTPFHMLAMRYDFDHDPENRIVNLAQILVENGADATQQYLGHNVLSISTLRGNTNLMEYILSNLLCDPNASLGNNMGVPLTMLTLRKYAKLLTPTSKIESVVETLTKHNANPFNEVPNFDGNAIEFAVASDKQSSIPLKTNVGLKILLDLSNSILRRYINSRALQLIFNSRINREHNTNNINLVILSNTIKYLNFDEAHRILQILLDNFIIPPNFDLCMKLLSYVHSRTGKGQLKINLIDKITSIATNDDQDGKYGKKAQKCKLRQFEVTKTLVQITLKDKVYELDFNREDKSDIVNPYKENMPEIDVNHEKYKVCYKCLERANKKLQLCPYCNLVYFCSVACNTKKNQSGEHPCKKVFYKTSKVNVLKSRRKTAKKIRSGSLDYSFSNMSVDEKDVDDDYSADLNFHFDDDDDDDSISSDETDSYTDSTSKGKRHKKKKDRKKGKGKKRRKMWKKKGRRRKKYDGRQWYKPGSRVIIKGRKICTSTCTGKLIAIGFKESLGEVQRKMKFKYKRPEMQHLRREVWSNQLKCKFPLNENNIDLMLRVAKRVNLQLVPISNDYHPLSPCDPFDYKFWHLFLPYCVFQNGELFYRSNDCDLLYKLPYKPF